MREQEKVVLQTPEWHRGKVSVYEDKIAVEGFCCPKGAGFFVCLVILPLILAVFTFWSPAGEPIRMIMIASDVAVAIWLFHLYKHWSDKYVIDFQKRCVYESWIFFRLPRARIPDSICVDAVLSVDRTMPKHEMGPKNRQFFYRVCLFNDLFGPGIPISGPMPMINSPMHAKYKLYVLPLFVRHGVRVYEHGEKTLDFYADKLLKNTKAENATKIHLDFRAEVVERIYLSTLFYQQYRHYRGILHPAFIFFSGIRILLPQTMKHKSIRILIELRKRQRMRTGTYIRVTRETFEGDTKVILLDERFAVFSTRNTAMYP